MHVCSLFVVGMLCVGFDILFLKQYVQIQVVPL